MIAQIQAPAAEPVLSDPAGLLAGLLCVLAGIFWLDSHPRFGRLFKVVPALVFCYFVPTLLTTLGIIPAESPLYGWVKDHVLPAALFLIILALDLPGIIRLGPKAITMMLAGTLGVVIGGPVALLIWGGVLPDEIWRGMAALSGSWIGGGANFVAMGQIAEIDEAMLAMMVVPDVFVASIWMGVLLYVSGHQHRIDRWTGADASAIRSLEERMADTQQRTARIASLSDLMAIVALAFAASWISGRVARMLPDVGSAFTSLTWKYVLITAIGVGLSLTRARKLEGAGASRIGSLMIYLLVACIGASADFAQILDSPALIGMGLTWMAVHVAVLLTAAWLLRAPVFLAAVGSQANIGGAASAPVVAAAFHPSLAPVGALLAVLGYVLGTGGGIVCMKLLQATSELRGL